MKAFQKDLGENDADDAWLGSLLKAFQKDPGALSRTSEQLILMMRLGSLLKVLQKDLGANDTDDAWLGLCLLEQMMLTMHSLARRSTDMVMV